MTSLFLVHLICGIWGTLAFGLFSSKASFNQLWTQFYGSVTIGAFTFILALIVAYSITINLRIHRREEVKGLDIAEHNMETYEIEIEKSEPVFSY